ncbi:MAG TPA: rubrerythrin [Firmicutes bacterium]|nr:rubrerythrin [Bacillota bacterium]HWR56863.1 rubrerythrin family protein [Negativicutes bacterium]
MSNTDKNLAAAFAGESQANRKYLAFAKQAELEGYKQAAKLFRAAAEAETIHAHTHLKNLGMIKSTAENLKAAIAGENYEWQEMYPGFIKDAEAEQQSAALRGFNLANGAEKVHAGLYEKAYNTLDQKEEYDYYLCTVCGNIVEKSVPESCEICRAKAQAFIKVE